MERKVLYSCFGEVNWDYWWSRQSKVIIYKSQNYVANGGCIRTVFGLRVLSLSGKYCVTPCASAFNWLYLEMVTWSRYHLLIGFHKYYSWHRILAPFQTIYLVYQWRFRYSTMLVTIWDFQQMVKNVFFITCLTFL